MHAEISDREISAFFAAVPAAIAWPYPMYARWQAGTGVVRWAGGPATLGQLRESIQRHVDDLVADMTASPVADVKTQLANKLPVRVIVDLIGVPQSDRDMIWGWSEAIAALFSLDQDKLKRADEAIDGFQSYVRNMIAQLRATGEGPERPERCCRGTPPTC